MLSSMRNSRKILSIVLWLVILAFVSTIFVVWGIGSRDNQATFVAKVDGVSVGYEEYRNFYDNTVQQLRTALGNAYDDYAKGQNLDFVIIQELINRKLLIAEAEKLKIPASDYEVIELIRNVPSFHNEQGSFDPEVYTQVLNYYRQTPAAFEKTVREDILVDKLQRLIRGGQYAVSETAIMNEYNFRETKAQVSYFAVPTSKFLSTEKPEDTALAEYYESNKYTYRVPASIKLKYVAFNPDFFDNSQTVVDPKEVESYYAENIAEYTLSDSVVMRTLVVPVIDWNMQSVVDSAKEKIDKALSEIKKDGSNFEAVVKKYADPVMAKNGGLVGTVYKGQLAPDFEEKVFVLEPGQVSEIVITDYGFQIAKVDSKAPGKVFTLDEKREEIAEKIKERKLASAYRTYILDIYKDILKAGNITAYMEANNDSGLKVFSTPMMTENESGLPVFLSQPKVKQDLFALNKTELSPIIEDGTVTYLFEVEDKVPAKFPNLEDVKVQVTEAFNNVEAAKKAIIDIEKDIAEQGFEKTAEKFNAPVTISAEFKRTKPEGIFTFEEDLIKDIFKTKPGETLKSVFIIGDRAYSIKVNSIIPPTADGFEAEREAITSYIRTIKEEDALVSYIESLKAKAKIEINPNFIGDGTQTK